MSDGQILFCQKINCKIKMMKPFVLALILILINAQIARCQVLYGSYTEKAFGYFVKPSMAAYIALIDDKEPKDKGVNNVHLIYIEKIDTSKMSIPTLSYIIVNANYDFNAYKNSADLKFCRKEDNNLWFLAFAPDVDSGYVNSFSFLAKNISKTLSINTPIVLNLDLNITLIIPYCFITDKIMSPKLMCISLGQIYLMIKK